MMAERELMDWGQVMAIMEERLGYIMAKSGIIFVINILTLHSKLMVG